METVGNTGLWLVFAAIVVGMLALDLFVLKGGHQHRVSLKEAAAWSLAWMTVALLFNLGLWWYLSIPAVFAITNDPFIVLTSNLFAILGLRAMYFLLADIGDRFAMLKYGLAIILVFIGIKMLIVDWYKIPVMVSLATVGTILLVSVIVSLWHNKRFPPHSHS